MWSVLAVVQPKQHDVHAAIGVSDLDTHEVGNADCRASRGFVDVIVLLAGRRHAFARKQYVFRRNPGATTAGTFQHDEVEFDPLLHIEQQVDGQVKEVPALGRSRFQMLSQRPNGEHGFAWARDQFSVQALVLGRGHPRNR